MFPLLKLPHLAQLNVLSVMAPYELFHLTLFLPNFRAMASTIQHSEDDASIFYDEGESTLGLQCKKTNYFRPIVKWECSKDEQVGVVHTINGHSLECKILPEFNDGGEYNYITITCLPKDHEWLSTTLWNHLYEIFPLLSPQIHIVSCHEAFPLIPETRPVKTLHLGDPLFRNDELTVSAETFEKFFDTRSVSDFACCKFEIEGDLKADSKVLNVETVILQRADNITLEKAQNFKGKNIVLRCPKLESPDILRTIKSWQQGTHLQNLDLLIIGENFNLIDQELILSELETHGWNPNERAAKFYSKTMTPLFPPTSIDPFDCTSSWDIRRDGDGMLASLMFSGRYYVSLFVWRDRFPKEQ